MKKIITIALTFLSLVSCTKLDEVWTELRDHEERIQKLETLCNKLNSNVEAIQTILTALKQNDYVTDIVKVVENGVEVGYSITFAKGGTVTIYHGTDGTDGSAPKVSIRKAQDGEYYWTADGEWMTDENGEMIPAVVADDPDGEYVTPLFRVADGEWFVSYDGGDSWMEVDKTDGSQATGPQGPQGPQGDNIFFDFFYDSTTVTFVLWDGTEICVPLNSVDLSFSNYAICINGDSISTESSGRWPVLLKNSIQFGGYKNIAVGGTRVKGEINSDERINRIPNTTNIILTLGGTNDWAQDIPLGDLSTIADPETFYGAVDLYIKKVLAKNPNIIVVMGSNPYGCCPGRFTSSDMDIEGGSYNNINESLHTYAKAIREVAEYNSVYYIPIYEECGINQYNYEENLLRQYNSFGNLVYLHPNDVGAAKMLKVIVRHLRNVIQWSQD